MSEQSYKVSDLSSNCSAVQIGDRQTKTHYLFTVTGLSPTKGLAFLLIGGSDI
jgi:hypothetical protein